MTTSVVSGPKPGDSTSVDLGNGVTLDLVWIPAGKFLMGSPTNEAGRIDDEGWQHQVTISCGYWMGKFPVTQAQWACLMGKNPSHFKKNKTFGLFGGETDPMLPVEQISWHEAKAFCEQLQTRLPEALKGKTVRLPTEAEWEYACRAGTTGPYAGELDKMGWYGKNSKRTPHPVGQKHPNAWGLHDMHGNVWEWCWDGKREYTANAVTDPEGAKSSRVGRGGGWNGDARECRSAFRYYGDPVIRDSSLGFRVVVR
jgi:formylglycine-generating enzyme required for sulfatase activity